MISIILSTFETHTTTSAGFTEITDGIANEIVWHHDHTHIADIEDTLQDSQTWKVFEYVLKG